MKKFTLLMVALLLSVMGVNAKTKTTNLWEETYTGGNIEISVADLVSGATITVFTTVKSSDTGDDRKLRIFYTAAGDNWTQTSFEDVSDWVELTAGQESYSFTLTSSAYGILSDDTKSHKILYIGANNKECLTITKITQTETIEPASTSDNLLDGDWASSKTDAKIFAPVSNAKIGDVLQFTVTTAAAWDYVQFKLTDKNGNVDQFTGEGSEPQGSNANTSFTLEFVISTVEDLVKIKSDGFGVIQTGDKAFTLTAVKLLSYSDSYAVEKVEMGSDGIMTYSNIYNLDFSDTGLTPYYTTSATTGKVTLTPATDKKTWNYQGYILKGDEGTYYPKVIGDNSGTFPNGNLLRGNVSEGTVYRSVYSDYTGTGENATKIQTYYRYIFAKKKTGDANIGFYKLTKDYTLAAHKAYLETSTDITPGTSGAPLMLDFGNGTTAIMDVFQDEMKQQQAQEDNVYYTLQGTRVQNPTKGLYILNGKKIIVK